MSDYNPYADITAVEITFDTPGHLVGFVTVKVVPFGMEDDEYNVTLTDDTKIGCVYNDLENQRVVANGFVAADDSMNHAGGEYWRSIGTASDLICALRAIAYWWAEWEGERAEFAAPTMLDFVPEVQ